MTIGGRRRSRARWVVVACGLGAVTVGLLGTGHAVRRVRESRAIAALDSNNPEERHAALAELARLRSVRAVPRILTSMEYRWYDATEVPGTGDSWEDGCARAIEAAGSRAAHHLVEKLRSDLSLERLWALRLLSRLELFSHYASESALSLLEDADGAVRREAAMACGIVSSRSPHLLERLASIVKQADGSENRRVYAATALEIAAELAFTRQAEPVARAVARAAALALLQGSEDPARHVRWECIEGLCNIKYLWSFRDLNLQEEIEAILRRWLDDEDATNRWMGLHWIGCALQREGGADEAPSGEILELVAARLLDRDSSVRSVAMAAVKDHEGFLSPALDLLPEWVDSISRLAADLFPSPRAEEE